MQRIVLDTNVVVSALLKRESPPALVLSLVLRKRVEACISEEIFAEYTHVMARKKFQKLNKNHVRQLLLKMHGVSLLVKPRKPLSVTADPDDNKFLECALEAKAGCIVTGNTRHFPKRFQNIAILTPQEFLTIVAQQI
jgi:putative PIN family toxin of toxin-antitoxin system